MKLTTLEELTAAGLIETASDLAWFNAGGYYDDTVPLQFKNFYENFIVFHEDCVGGKAGEPIPLLDWQYNDIIRKWYGCLKADGSYRYETAIVVCMKKVGKTSFCAAINLFHQLFEAKTCESYIIASNIRQANVCFKTMERILRYGPLKELLRTRKETELPIWIHNSTKLIEYVNEDGFKSTCQILPFSEEVDGFSITNLIMDEFCALPAKLARTVWEKLDHAVMSRKGRKFLISTPQYDMTSWGYTMWQLADRILKSAPDSDNPFIDTHTLPVLYGVDDEASCECGKCVDGNKEAWRCPAHWAKSNPSYNQTVSADYYHKEYAAVQNDPMKEVSFKQFLCGIWTGNSHQWIASNVWAKNKSDIPLKFFEENKVECSLGIDMSLNQDLSAVSMSFKYEDNIYLFGHCFLPREGIEKKEKRDRKRYRADYVAKGLMTLTAGEVIDQRVIRDYVKDLAKRFKVTEIRYDPSRFQQSAILMLNEDFLPMVEVKPHTASMHQPILFFERGVTNGTIKNDGNPLMLYCLQNTAVKITNEQLLKIEKHKSTGRIDLIISSILAASYYLDKEPIPESYGFFM